MNVADWSILALIGISTLIGVVRGFAREAIAFGAWLLGIWLAWHFSPLVEPYLGGVLAHPPVKVWIARLIILVAVLLLGALIGMIMSYFIRHSPFGTTDRMLGGLFGLLRGAVLIGLVAMVGHLLELDSENWWSASKLMPYAEIPAGWLRHLGDFSDAVN